MNYKEVARLTKEIEKVDKKIKNHQEKINEFHLEIESLQDDLQKAIKPEVKEITE